MGRAVGRLLLLFVLLVAGPAFATPSEPQPSPSALGQRAVVREGRTELEAPRASASAPQDAADAAPTASTLPSSAGDAPQIGTGVLHLPPQPPGFNSYDAGWVRFIYHPSSRERVQPLIAEAELVRHELSERLGFPVLAQLRVEIARTPGEMATFAPSGAPYPEYAAGVAYPELGLVLLSLAPVHPGTEHDLREVFRHELAHVALNDAVNDRPVPRWFNEGFAMFASGESSFKRMQTLAMSTIGGSLIALRDLDHSFPDDETQALVAYAEAQDVLRFLVRREDAHRFRALVSDLRDGKSFEQSVLGAYGVELSSVEFEWREDVSRRYTIWLFLLGGSFVWVIALGVFVWAWRRRRRRDKLVLQRWAREEAAEDAMRARLRNEARVHIVLAHAPEASAAGPLALNMSEVEIPVVEHDGAWHTLH